MNHKTSRKQFLLMAFAMVMGVFALVLSPATTYAKTINEEKVSGTLESVDVANSSVVIRIRGGATRNIKVQATTKIERNDRRVALSKLVVGDKAQARISTVSGLTTKLESVGP